MIILFFSTLALVSSWKNYYVFFDPRLLFVIGLVFSRSLSNSAIVSVLMWYFAYYDSDLVTSAILSNTQEALSSLLVIFMAHASDSFVGRFRTILFSTTAYIGGILLLWMFNPYDVLWLVVIALILLALGTSANPLLLELLTDMVNRADKSADRTQERVVARAKIWWRFGQVFGAISATLWVVPSALGGVHPSWGDTFLICFITMLVTLLIFCLGNRFYHQDKLIHRPVEIFFRVCYASFQNLRSSKSLYLFNGAKHERSPLNVETEMQENAGRVHEGISPLQLDIEGKQSYCTKEEIAVVKSLSRMFPMWATFFVVSLISATGSTFFIEQYSNLNGSERVPFQIYNLIQDFSGFVIPLLYDLIKIRFLKNDKVKIGIGMLCSILCCVLAWILEVHRLREVKNLDDEDANTNISFIWLMPQFCLLGSMEGLTEEGVFKFFQSRINEPIKRYGEQYIEVVLGLGKLLNIFLILIFKSQGWFGETINSSYLDKYYRLLACVCFVNLVIYCAIARWVYKDDHREQDPSNDNLITIS